MGQGQGCSSIAEHRQRQFSYSEIILTDAHKNDPGGQSNGTTGRGFALHASDLILIRGITRSDL